MLRRLLQKLAGGPGGLGLGPVDDRLFVALAYHMILGRPPDPKGQARYTAELAAGDMSRRNLLDLLMASDEARHLGDRPVGQRLAALEDNLANLLKRRYAAVAAAGDPAARLRSHEFKVHSQHGEDGILLYLFSLVGAATHQVVEFGIEDGRECNAANLIINFGWRGLLMDCVPENVEAAQRYYAQRLGPEADRVAIDLQQVSPENIDQLLAARGLAGEIDLLSIDIDGNDYWVFEAISQVEPRVVVIEYNASLGPRRAAAVRPAPDFDRFACHPSGYYHGASLAAMAKLGRQKGYALVGCDSSGANAFLVRRDLLSDQLPEQEPAACFYPHRRRTAAEPLEQQMRLTAEMDFIEV